MHARHAWVDANIAMDAWASPPHVVRMPSVLPLVVVVTSGILYHVAQKLAVGARPWRMLAIAYGAAFALTLVLALAGGGDRPAVASGRERTAGLLLGLSVFGVEAGFFFIYRAGWPLASASVITGALVTASLATIGVLGFGEALTPVRGVGLGLAVAASALIARGAS